MLFVCHKHTHTCAHFAFQQLKQICSKLDVWRAKLLTAVGISEPLTPPSSCALITSPFTQHAPCLDHSHTHPQPHQGYMSLFAFLRCTLMIYGHWPISSFDAEVCLWEPVVTRWWCPMMIRPFQKLYFHRSSRLYIFKVQPFSSSNPNKNSA